MSFAVPVLAPARFESSVHRPARQACDFCQYLQYLFHHFFAGNPRHLPKTTRATAAAPARHASSQLPQLVVVAALLRLEELVRQQLLRGGALLRVKR